MPTSMADPSYDEPMFVPYPFYPLCQPNSRAVSPSTLHQELERLTQKLDVAERKIEEYARSIASLYTELQRYQDIICPSCKENIFLATAPLPTSSGFASQPIVASRILSEPCTPESSGQIGDTGVQVATAPPFPSSPRLAVHHGQLPASSQSVRVHSPAARGNINPDDLIIATSSLDNPQANVTSLPQGSPTVLPYSSDSDLDSKPPQQAASASTPDNTTNADPTQPDWSVEYNPKINQILNVHVVNTFKFKAAVLCTKFSYDGKYLGVGLGNGETHVHNVMTGSNSILVERPATVFYTEEAKTPSAIWAVRFSPDNMYIATGGRNGQINIWEISRRRIRASFKHKNLVRSLHFSPDGRFLVSASFDKSVCMWRIRDGSRRTLLHDSFRFMSAAFSPDGRSVAAGSSDGVLRICDARTSHLVAKWTIADRGTFNLRSVAFTPDGKGIASGYSNLRCWDISSLSGRHSRRHMIQDDTTSQMNQIFEFKGHNRAIAAVSFSSDNLLAVSSSFDKNVCILDAGTGSWVCTLKGHVHSVRGADFSPTGHYIVSGGLDSQVRLWRYDVL